MDLTNSQNLVERALNTIPGIYNGMRRNGVYIAFSLFKVLFVSAAHSAADIDETIRAAEVVLKKLHS
jgi:glutamate-1-semialdehyde aminotransferase